MMFMGRLEKTFRNSQEDVAIYNEYQNHFRSTYKAVLRDHRNKLNEQKESATTLTNRRAKTMFKNHILDQIKAENDHCG